MFRISVISKKIMSWAGTRTFCFKYCARDNTTRVHYLGPLCTASSNDKRIQSKECSLDAAFLYVHHHIGTMHFTDTSKTNVSLFRQI